MLDPHVIASAAKSSPHIGSEARTTVATGFLAGVAGMDVDAASNAANVHTAVQLTSQQMRESLAGVKDAIDAQVKAHQNKQRARRSFDYQPDMDDLRPTDATGFPRELSDAFYAPFKRR